MVNKKKYKYIGTNVPVFPQVLYNINYIRLYKIIIYHIKLY